MKLRLPRKAKKEAKKIVARKSAMKLAMVAVVQGQSMIRLAMISSTPFKSVPEKGFAVVDTVKDTAGAINKIMSEPPHTWREFIKR